MKRNVFDSNIFINLERRQPIDIFPSLWGKIGELMEQGTIISSQEVYDELLIGSDDLGKWAENRKESFFQSSVPVQQKVREILATYRGLVEGGKKKNSADPFVIALADIEHCTVVTEEVRTRNLKSPKIPDVCDIFSIECVDFVTFAREQKLSF